MTVRAIRPSNQTISAEEVAFEFVATKIALIEVIEDLVCCSPTELSELAHDWSRRAPVDVELDEPGVQTRLAARVFEIEAELLTAAGQFMLNRARAVEKLADEYR